MDFVAYWRSQSGFSQKWFCRQIGIREERLIDWRRRFGVANAHNGCMPRYFWISADERDRIIDFYLQHPEEGYRRCTYMMIDSDIAYVSPATTWRVLSRGGYMRRPSGKPSAKGRGFNQPRRPHEHWHTDISCVQVQGAFYFLINVLDGCSRYIMHWDLRSSMETTDVSIVQQGALEKAPEGVRPRIISDRGSQFTAREFRQFISLHGLTQATTSPYYPQSNGKIERWYGTVKREAIRGKALSDLDHAKEILDRYVKYYNNERLHSAIGYVTPADRLAGRAEQIQQERDRKLAEARRKRKNNSFSLPPYSVVDHAETDVKDVAV